MSASRSTRRPDPATERLTGWIEPVIGAAGYDLEELVVTPAGRRSVVRVVVDRQPGWLVSRPPLGATRVVDLYLCGSDTPERSATLPFE